MEEKQGYQKDIESIPKADGTLCQIISLSGLSGILAGVYAFFGPLRHLS